jgi:hypothetical protein
MVRKGCSLLKLKTSVFSEIVPRKTGNSCTKVMMDSNSKATSWETMTGVAGRKTVVSGSRHETYLQFAEIHSLNAQLFEKQSADAVTCSIPLHSPQQRLWCRLLPRGSQLYRRC